MHKKLLTFFSLPTKLNITECSKGASGGHLIQPPRLTQSTCYKACNYYFIVAVIEYTQCDSVRASRNSVISNGIVSCNLIDFHVIY